MKNSIITYALIFSSWACVDRITFDVGTPDNFPIVIDGFISDEPGPYTIYITKSFDIESKQSIRTPLSVRSLVISDDQGNREKLVEVTDGEYQTSPSGIRGTIGRVYTLEIELLDGRVYRSIPDPLKPNGEIESVYFEYKEEKNTEGAIDYGFDVFFNAQAGQQSNFNFLWKFVGTFQVETNPELYTVRCGESRCPAPLPCSSYVLGSGGLEYAKPCECCTCWSNLYNDIPLVSDGKFVENGRFTKVKATYVPITQWTFLYKVHAEVQQFSLSPNAYAFWKAIRDQKLATGSLFAPQAGKIPSNFTQISGEPGSIEGIFFSASIRKKSVYITQGDIPNPSVIPDVDPLYTDTCEKLFPGSTTVKPDFWID
jgi:hypothetical protein